jgi:cytochrome o ubiquinol oxidase subunit 1
MWGKLTWAAIPLDQPIPLITSAVVILVILGILLWVAVKGWVPYLWREWITSVDHKRSGSCISCSRWLCCCAGSPTRS